ATTSPSGLVSASMGSPSSLGEERRRDRTRANASDASMGSPRSLGEEKDDRSCDGSRSGLLQRGRRDHSAKRTPRTSRSLPSARFNGVAEFTRRRAQTWRPCQRKTTASMGSPSSLGEEHEVLGDRQGDRRTASMGSPSSLGEE